jgi:hypothetical protein
MFLAPGTQRLVSEASGAGVYNTFKTPDIGTLKTPVAGT